MPLRQSPSDHEMHAIGSQRQDAVFIEQELLHRALDIRMSLERGILIQLVAIVRTDTALIQIINWEPAMALSQMMLT